MPAEWRVRRARLDDLPGIIALEQEAFQPWRQSSPRSLKRSLESPRQSVWVIDAPGSPAGSRQGGAGSRPAPATSIRLVRPAAACLVLWHHPRTVRVYGIATRPDLQGKGLGRALMEHAERLAQDKRIVLEADASDTRLLAWYETQGYARTAHLPDFYAPGRHAWRLEKRLDDSQPASG